MIECPICGHEDSIIRWQSNGNRGRKCKKCCHEWTTEERHPRDRATLERLVKKYSHRLFQLGELGRLELLNEPEEVIVHRIPVLGKVGDRGVITWY